MSLPPTLVLVLVLLVARLLSGRYVLFSPLAVSLLVALAVVFAAWTFYAENRFRFDRAFLATALLVLLFTTVEVAGLIHLLSLLFVGGSDIKGPQLLASGVYFWGSNVLAFGLWYWLIDRGGPHVRARRGHGKAEFLFPEMTAGEGIVDPNWSPNIIEYMYLSFTNSTAFSPTDTLPLSSRARILMMVESTMSLVSIALVTARAVNILS